ncbi:MAG: stage 0 sporulation family protein [Eubacterium sp.]|nr:stage 0 sporulation family protein [Eubacterium sp.]
MIDVVGIRFRNTGKIYYFNPKNIELKKGDHVIVETAVGVEYGEVALEKRQVTDDQVKKPVKDIMRKANEKDDQKYAQNQEKEKKAYKTCKEKIAKHGLEMKLIKVEYTFDGKKIMFYFTADGRVDFRELVKDLASVFRTRIELRQVGVRDEAKLIGGIGMCGRELCCSTFLPSFAPVTIKMAKEQNLSLNPTKISGICGRLMCCLKNEQESYEYLNSSLPDVGERVKTFDGFEGEVTSVNVLKQEVKIVVEEDEEREIKTYNVSELKFKPKKKKFDLAAEELKELQGLEDKDDNVEEADKH